MDFVTVVILYVMFSTPMGGVIIWLPVVDMATCEATAQNIVGLLAYDCISINEGLTV